MNIGKFIRRITSAFLSCILMTFYFSEAVTVRADNISDTELITDYYRFDDIDTEILSFSEYYDAFSEQKRPENEIVVKAVDYTSAADGNFSAGSYGSDNDIRENVLIWKGNEGELTYNIDIKETGNYCLNVTYFPINSDNTSAEFSMFIDGKIPYDTASRLTLNRVWVNEREIFKDSRGNQVRPSQIQQGKWCSADFGDVDGLFSEPLFFYLEKGKHEIKFSSDKADIALESFRFYNPNETMSYDEYVLSTGSSPEKEPFSSNIIRIEGENAVYKSAQTLYPTYDNSSYNISPSDPVKMVYNTIGGGGSWKKPLESVTWIIPSEDIKSDGWYKIGIKSRQNQMRGLYSNRRIYINGEVLCKELEQVRFFYGSEWSLVSPMTDDGEYIYVYLTADKDNTVTFEAIPGEIGDSLRKLDSMVAELNVYYRKILMITGPSPDKYTDYYVHEKIPELVENLEKLSDRLKSIQSEIESLSGTKGSEAAAIGRMTVTLDKCVKKPLKIPEYLSQIKDDITSVSSWMREYRDQPLEIDYIEFATADRKFTSVKEKTGKAIAFGWKSFIGSFFEDYTTLSDVKGEEALDVWISLGRDQAQVIKEMVENDFMPEYDIPVSLNLVSGGVVEAALAGKGPDVALFLGGEFPVNLAARDLIEEVSQFSDYSSVASRFGDTAMTHYTYNEKVYGLPISRNFPMMFYRTDILTELGYNSPPQTWNELRNILPSLQRNYMNVGLVLPQTNVSPSTESGHTFALLLLQRGGNYYNHNLTSTTLDSIEAVQAFEEWTDFYKKYSFVQQYDAFSRFRTGEYPILIANYTFYNQLTAASPEIKGLWDFCPVPGTKGEDGSISHAANSNGSGAVIFRQVGNKENAWEFIKWFTETETQIEYASRIEGILGIMGRFDTANIEALKQLPWTDDELFRLMTQQSELKEIPVIPSSYAVTRNIMNAFREVINEGENPRDTLMWYNRDINEEIKRKQNILK